jgi:hypothetical protein
MRVACCTIAACVGIYTLAFGAEQSPNSEKSSKAHVGDGADACGWFAVLDCFSSRQAAWEFNDQVETGRTIDTDIYPSFEAGLYCVVKGPSTYEQANENRKVFNGVDVKPACAIKAEHIRRGKRRTKGVPQR